jgi:hypothetical protein
MHATIKPLAELGNVVDVFLAHFIVYFRVVSLDPSITIHRTPPIDLG